MEVGFVSSLLLSYKKYCKVMDVFEKKEKILKKEYEDSSDKLYSKLNLISKYIDKLSMEISSKKQDLALSVNECGKLYMDLSEDKVEYKDDTIEENIFGFGAGAAASLVAGVGALPAVGILVANSA